MPRANPFSIKETSGGGGKRKTGTRKKGVPEGAKSRKTDEEKTVSEKSGVPLPKKRMEWARGQDFGEHKGK